MRLTPRHRKAARTLWDCGGQVGDAAAREGIRPGTLHRWLSDPEFRAMVAHVAAEPLHQATSAVVRWAPVAVARLIEDLEGESSADARHAAREILKLALDTQREAARQRGGPARAAGEAGSPGDARDPLSRRVAGLTDGQLLRVLAILNEEPHRAKENA